MLNANILNGTKKEVHVNPEHVTKPAWKFHVPALPELYEVFFVYENHEGLKICLAQCHCPHDCCRHYRWHKELDSCGTRKCRMLGIMVRCSNDPTKNILD
jgi:hypothetical protein